MGLTASSARKLASLSALGAGALALTADTAEASIIVSTNTMVIDCGCFGLPFDTDILSDSSRSVLLGFALAGQTRTPAASSFQYFSGVKGFGAFYGSGGSGPLRFRVTPGGFTDSYAPQRFIRLFAKGAAWPGPPAASTTASMSAWGGGPGVAVAHKRFDVVGTSTVGSGSTFPNPYDPLNAYAMFSFSDTNCADGTCYGWVNLGIEQTLDGFRLTVRSWAYDDSGAQLFAGEGDPIPEPSTMVLAGIGALALGARGIRRWRAQRNQS